MIYDWFKSFSAVLQVNGRLFFLFLFLVRVMSTHWRCHFVCNIHVCLHPVLAYDYTGYGRSREAAPGIVPNEQFVYNDVQAAYGYLRSINIEPSQIVLYGRSLGSGPTCFLAQQLTAAGTPCAGVILQSPLLSAYRVAFNFRFTMAGDMFPNIDRMRKIESPVFIIHGVCFID